VEHPASSLLDERAAGPAGSDLVNLCCLSSEDGGRGRVLARPRVRRGRPTREAGHGGAHLAVSCCWEAVDPHARLEALPHPGPGRTHGSFVLYVLRGYSRELSKTPTASGRRGKDLLRMGMGLAGWSSKRLAAVGPTAWFFLLRGRLAKCSNLERQYKEHDSSLGLAS